MNNTKMNGAEFLTSILARRRQRIAELRRTVNFDELRTAAYTARQMRVNQALRAALNRQDKINVIAEVKRASASKGLIRGEVDAAALATEYAEGGACGISVLTEEDYFRGSLDDLRAARARVTTPLLRKDFVLDEVQIYEAATAGADAVLLIVRALEDAELTRMRVLIEDELGMDALIEVHTATEMLRAADAGAVLIGVNNRNLDTFEVTLDTSIELAQLAPHGATLVSESGLRTGADLQRLRACGYHGFLIGETLMRAADPRRALKDLIDEAQDASEEKSAAMKHAAERAR